MMKKIIALILAVLFCMAFVACGESDPKQRDSDSAKAAETEAVTEKATEAPTEAATEKSTEAPTEKATEAPTEKATEAPVVSGGMTLDEFLQTADGQKAIEQFKTSAESEGNCKADCYAEGDTLVFEAELLTQIPESSLSSVKSVLQEYLEEESNVEVFESMITEIENVGIDNPKVKVVYRNADGSVLAEKTYG